MEKVFYEPWIGDNYCTGGVFQRRILVLGESYYEDPDRYVLPRTFTKDHVEGHIEGKRMRTVTRFYNRVARVFLGRPLTLTERRGFWHSIAHYTFVQAPVGKKPSDRPTPGLWEGGRESFLSVVQQHIPEFILVLGCELWCHLPDPKETETVNIGGEQVHTYKYLIGIGNHALACHINHPSSRKFKSESWYPFVVEAIKLAGPR
jgi:hypothetical protein